MANGITVDVGPNWVHGTDNNSILDIAKETNTALGSWETGSYVFNENGELYSLKDVERYSKMMWDIVQAAFKHSNKNSAMIDPNESLLDFFKVTLKELIPESTENWQRKRDIVLQMADLWGAFVGSPVERQSLKFFWLEECIEGGKSSPLHLVDRVVTDTEEPQRTSTVPAPMRRFSTISPRPLSKAQSSTTTPSCAAFMHGLLRKILSR